MAKVFISYRRVDASVAHLVATKLRERLNAEIVTDHDIDMSDFAHFIECAILECAVFISIVTPNTFAPERIHNADDWIQRETSLALRLKPTAIALALIDGIKPPSFQKLPLNIQEIANKQGIPIHVDEPVLDNCVDKLAELCASIGNLSLHDKRKQMTPANEIHAGRDAFVISDSSDVRISIGSQRQELTLLRQTKIELRDQAARRIALLTEQSARKWTCQGYALAGIVILTVIAFAFSIHTLIGFAACVVTIGIFLRGRNEAIQKNQEKQAQLSQAQDQLKQLVQDIDRIDQEMKDL